LWLARVLEDVPTIARMSRNPSAVAGLHHHGRCWLKRAGDYFPHVQPRMLVRTADHRSSGTKKPGEPGGVQD